LNSQRSILSGKADPTFDTCNPQRFNKDLCPLIFA
jgi:hypothetical protein